MRPYHQHDCNNCTYLGSTMTDKGPVDWYVHDDSVLARGSSRGPDYWSSLVSIVMDDKYLTAKYNDNQVVNGMNIIARHMLSRKDKTCHARK